MTTDTELPTLSRLLACPFCGKHPGQYPGTFNVTCENGDCPAYDVICSPEEWNSRQHAQADQVAPTNPAVAAYHAWLRSRLSKTARTELDGLVGEWDGQESDPLACLDKPEVVEAVKAAIQDAPLCISSSRRGGNGLRNADEVL